ncbi:MAG TPA: alpha-ketoacid dehydrogenase subunit beta [Dehalococcoidia bacterium]|nr:alpha-ketoacid dehydrogenase subunit beta [Dehalococcoidia bacterium]
MPEITYLEAINQALHEEMARDPDVFMAGIDIAQRGDVFGATQGIYSKYGNERIMDTPIAESGIMGLAIGAAARGLRPVVTVMFMDFIGVCFDQILNQMAKMKYMYGGKVTLPLTVLTNAGAGTSSAAQHSQSLEVLLCHIPGLKVVMASTPYDAKGLMKASIREDNPVFFVQHKRLGRTRGEVPEGDYEVPLGKGKVVREGKDITLVATSWMVHEALAAADKLAERGIEAEVVDPRTLVPLDMETIVESVKKTHRVVVAHEAVRFCGIGGEIAAQITEEAFDYLDGPPLRIGAPSSPVPYSPVLEKEWVPDSEDIIAAANTLVGG